MSAGRLGCASTSSRGEPRTTQTSAPARTVVENDRTLRLHEPAFAECPLQRLGYEEHRRPVRTVPRLFHEQQPSEQLDRLVLVQNAVVDQARVFVTSPPALDGPSRLLHDRYSWNKAVTGAAKPGRISSPESVSPSVNSRNATGDRYAYTRRPRIDDPDNLHVGGEVLAKL